MINYYLITKPGIIFGNLFTVAAGFILGSQGHINLLLFLETLLGMAFIMGSACIFNNYIDRHLDKKMNRTNNRALANGRITPRNALLLACALELIGNIILMVFTNVLTVAIAGIGFFVYVVLYSFWKSRTVYGTAIGSIAGAVPPIVGYCAASNTFDLAAALLFAILVLWQMPHFFAIAFLHLEDYAKAGIPVLPLSKGVTRTKIHMVLYILAFIPITLMLTLFDYTGQVFLIVTSCLGFAWLALSIKGFFCEDNKLWGKQMFRLSLVIIAAICLIIPFDRI